MRRILPRAGWRLWLRRRARRCRMWCRSRAARRARKGLSLLVGIFQYQPSPFCVLDEVDAALDETNVGRLADLLHGMSGDTQFLLVTHSKRMMQTADMIYGVTMQEPGVSKIVSVHLGNRLQDRSRERATA